MVAPIMRKATILGLGLSLLLLAPFGLHAQSGNAVGQTRGSRTITTAVPFLLVSPDSRSGGMGEVGVAIADDANAMHWNPSALAFIDRKMGFAMNYTPWLRSLGIPDINLMYLSGYYRTGDIGTLGASLRYFSLGTIQLTDQLGQATGEENPSEFALDVGYSLRISEVLTGAISLRYYNSRLNSAGNLQTDLRPVNSVAGDVSFMYKKDFVIRGQSNLPVEFSSGINISNLGPKVSYTQSQSDRDFIPTNIRIGYAFKFFIDEYNTITLTNDFNKLLVPSVQYDSTGITGGGGRSDAALLEGYFGSFGDSPAGFGGEMGEINIAVGAEYWYRELFAVRAGYFHEPELYGNRKFVNVGAGIRYNVFGLHFAYLIPFEQNHPLQNTLRFTLTYDFDSPGNE